MTELEALRINNIAFLLPPLVLGSNPSGPTNVFPSAGFQSADLSVFRGAILIEKTAQDSRQGLPWKAAIHGCAFQSRKKSRCIAQEQTAEEGVHQFPSVAHRSARYRCWFPAARYLCAPFETHRNWIGRLRRWWP